MVAPGDCLEPSRHARAASVFDAGIEHAGAGHADFTRRASVMSVGGATLIRVHAASSRVRPAAEGTAGSPADALCIYQKLDGGGWFGAGGSQFVVAAGSLAASCFDLPIATRPASNGAIHLRVVKIPLSRCKALIGPRPDLAARSLSIEPGPTALFASYFEAFVDQAPHLTDAGAEAAVQALAQLTIVARGMAKPYEGCGRDAIHAGLLQNARQTIESNIHRSDLSPAIVAGLLGISVRQLHLLFEPIGVTCARYTLSRRLEHARVLLAQTPTRSVADIAYDCGFDSLSTFYRSFRGAVGMSPTDFRESARQYARVRMAGIPATSHFE